MRDTPIKQKLVIVMGLVTTVALLTAGLTIFISDLVLFNERLRTDVDALSQIIADETTAALAFDDPQTAAEVLRPLKARAHLLSACLYRADGSLLASYIRSDLAMRCAPPQPAYEMRSIRGDLRVSRPVLLQGRQIGMLVILYDRGEIFARMRRYGVVILLVLVASSCFSFLISSRLRDLIARPIEELARASSAVSRTRDYSIRAQKLSADELGTLVDAFNQMLSDIQTRDIELQKALTELQDSNQSLGRSNADLERFAFVASHDLQEPLRMMTVFSQLLSRKYAGQLDAEAATFIGHIVGGAKRMRELLADLLEYTHLSSRPNLPAAAVDLNVVLDRAKENLAAAIVGSGAVIASDSLPIVSGHEAHFLPLFQNLIGNAIKYRSSERPKVEVSVAETRREYKFAIADNGIGIAPEYQEKIFLAFQRLHGKEIPGTGIGLAICHRVVEQYGGRIWVESQLGKGSTFVFTLPRDGTAEGQLKNG